MAYGDRDEVKILIGIKASDDRFDDEIDDLLKKASRYIDAYLRKYISVPLTSPDDIIDEIANDFSACYYRENKAGMSGLVDKRDVMCLRGKEKLKAYIDGKFHGSGAVAEGREEMMGKPDYVYQDENYGLDGEDYY